MQSGTTSFRFLGGVVVGAVLLGGGMWGLAASGPAARQASQAIPYTGQLDENGVAFTGTRDLTFHLWNDVAANGAGNLLWTDTFAAVDVRSGRFAVSLGGGGQALPDAVWQAEELFVSVDVNGTPLTGRQRLGSVAYARRAAPGADFRVDGVIYGNGAGLTRVLGAKVAEVSTNVAASTLQVNGLNLDQDGMYIVVVKLNNTQACNFEWRLRFSGDVAAANYAAFVRQDAAVLSGPGVSTLTHYLDATVAQSGSSARHVGTVQVFRSPSGRVVASSHMLMEGTNPRGATADLQTWDSSMVWSPPMASNVTSLTLDARHCGSCGGCTTNAGLGPGSSMVVYRAAP